MATTRGWALYRNISNAIVYILVLKHSQEKTTFPMRMVDEAYTQLEKVALKYYGR